MTSATADRPQLVFVDGIGGRSVLRRPLLSRLAVRGHARHDMDYRPSRHSFEAIRTRLGERLAAVAADGPYVLIGYSFGGVLARSVLTTRPEIAPPERLVLVASPMRSLRRRRTARAWPPLRWLTGDCGQLLADEPTSRRHGRRRRSRSVALRGRAGRARVAPGHRDVARGDRGDRGATVRPAGHPIERGARRSDAALWLRSFQHARAAGGRNLPVNHDGFQATCGCRNRTFENDQPRSLPRLPARL